MNRNSPNPEANPYEPAKEGQVINLPRPEEEETSAEIKEILNWMVHCENNISMVARKMGISRNTLYKKLRKYELIHNESP